MFRHIVVGAAGTHEGKDAAALGAGIAEATGSELTLVRAVDCPASDAPPGGSSARRRALHQLSELRELYAPGAKIELIRSDDAAAALRAFSDRADADLVVIGSSRSALPGRCAVSTTGRQLLDRLPIAVAIARRGLGQSGARLDGVAVGYDGGAESESARAFAQELAAAADAELLIETIYELPTAALAMAGPAPLEPIEDPRAAERRTALAVAERALASALPNARMGVCVGEAGPALRRASEGADLMVIGSRRCGPTAGTILGGAGEWLASDCGCSLIVLPRHAVEVSGRAR